MLSGKVDLTIGRPAGAESRKVIIDLKTGWVSPKHREDLRFYALVETLRTQIPPRKLASFYLDAGEPVVEDVNERLLLTASRRMLDGVNAEIELKIEDRVSGQAARHIVPVVPDPARVHRGSDLSLRRRRPRSVLSRGTSITLRLDHRSGDISANATPSPAPDRTVAIRRPGWTAGLGALTSSGPSRAAAASRSATLSTKPNSAGDRTRSLSTISMIEPRRPP